MKLLVSKYSFTFEYKNKYYLYNTLSNSLIEIDKSIYSLLKNNMEENKEVNQDEIDNETLEELLKRNFLVEDQTDGFLKYKTFIQHRRAESKFMHLTIAPTMDCCFNCHYCFEKYKKKGYMSAEVMDSIVKYIEMRQDLKSIKLTWFGGEPLMAVPQIEMFYDKFIAYWKDRPFSSNIITTGYHLDKYKIKILQKVKVTSAQITIDGLKETHNSIKKLDNDEDVFEKVMDNIELTNDLAPEIAITIRVNLTRKNCNEYIELNNYLTHRFANKKNISWGPAFVLNRGKFTPKEEDSYLFDRRSMAEYALILWQEHKIKSQFICYPRRFFDECAIRNDLAISFDPEGYAYKCWEIIGNRTYSIGQINENGKIINVNEKMLNRQLCGADPLDDPKCSKCRYLPICNGGCPIQRIENMFENKQNDCCSIYKNCLLDVLKIHIDNKCKGEAENHTE